MSTRRTIILSQMCGIAGTASLLVALGIGCDEPTTTPDDRRAHASCIIEQLAELHAIDDPRELTLGDVERMAKAVTACKP